MEQRTLIYAFAAGRIAFGGALLALPSKVGSSWIGKDAEGAATQVAIRGLGVRDGALAAGSALAASRGRPLRPWLVAMLAGDLVDIASTLAAGQAVPASGRKGTVALAGASALMGAALVAAVDE